MIIINKQYYIGKHKNTKYYVLIGKIFKNIYLLKIYSRICKNEYVLFYSGSYETC